MRKLLEWLGQHLETAVPSSVWGSDGIALLLLLCSLIQFLHSATSVQAVTGRSKCCDLCWSDGLV